MKFTDKWTWAAAMLISACAVSCSDNDDPQPDGSQPDANELPGNTYPVEFTASIEKLSRATADDTWNVNRIHYRTKRDRRRPGKRRLEHGPHRHI